MRGAALLARSHQEALRIPFSITTVGVYGNFKIVNKANRWALSL